MAASGSRYLLLVNPSAGAGRAKKLGPEIEAEMRRRNLDYRIVETTGIEHGCAEAGAGAEAGEIPVVVSGDGLIGKVGGILAGTGTPLGVIPGGRGNDFARVVGIPTEPAEDFPGETFRVLKNKDEAAYGEYRTRRLVLEAWERQATGA